MATIKSFTSVEQSRKLAEILPIESADMHYGNFSPKGLGYENELSAGLTSYIKEIKVYEELKEYYKIKDYNGIVAWKVIPCWSLAALLDILPEGTRLLKSTNISSVGDTKYHCDCPKSNIDSWFDNPVDACYVMIIRLHELNLL